MSRIVLSREGIFPIKGDARTGFDVQGTIQGEGKLCGVPSLFVRTQGCNLRCLWLSGDGRPCTCDTRHTSFEAGGDAFVMDSEEIFRTIIENLGAIRHIVITGGEPMLQAENLAPLIEALRAERLHVTIETNGTIFDRRMAEAASLLSISPKLPGSIPTDEKLAAAGLQPNPATRQHAAAIANIEPLQQLIDTAKTSGNDVQLKFVVSHPDDEADIKSIFTDKLSGLGPDDILLMPMGTTPADIRRNGLVAAAMAVRNGWRYSPRLHIDLFGNREGT